MLLNIGLLVIGLVLILVGANYMTDGAASIARRFGMSDFIVGLTVVSMMTSAPELVVSITSSINASTEMAVGNIVGSNIFNILIIIGIVAVICPIKINKGLLYNELPLVILSSVVLLIMGNAPLLDGGSKTLTRVDGLILLLFFIIFMRYTISSAKRQKCCIDNQSFEPENINANEAVQNGEKRTELSLVKAIIFLLGGLAALIFGGQWFVNGASGLARTLGWSEALIGLTILAAGTSLPELATSIVAATKGFPGMCIGNVIGSNIFNIFLVLGLTSTVKPLQFGSIGNIDLLTLTIASIIFWITARYYKDKTISRLEGVLMVILYIAYIVTLYLQMS